MPGSTMAAPCRTASAMATRCCGWAVATPTRRRLERAFHGIGAPFTVLDLTGAAARDIYGYDLILVRPDLHVVWRGNAPPADPQRLAAMATGH